MKEPHPLPPNQDCVFSFPKYFSSHGQKCNSSVSFCDVFYHTAVLPFSQLLNTCLWNTYHVPWAITHVASACLPSKVWKCIQYSISKHSAPSLGGPKDEPEAVTSCMRVTPVSSLSMVLEHISCGGLRTAHFDFLSLYKAES